ncbi:hypothetical protein CHLNCDRAFT_136147 [Chlorella variabilis]|uniref:Uncharacterized protein n=1 Tax=Chlorella variabilis TaxID=554065 RepID=E1ZJV4_CHLVA|nr:hypothetical protein CHLNCDRAFT_136147 [Chlorella variabilis]EFN53926.1 hypothetical protein CHLNCDRAFT_136147 [Chlorella variabilis]|eukprot:XP_005846028.1 hypothetical protein CHLNCDRAFT_136147 [Chlorella variabilis]
MVNEAEVVEKKLGMSLDELIAEQKKKQGSRPAGGAKKKTIQTKGNGRVLVVPRPKHVPRPSPKAGLKGTRGGGVAKHGPAPKFYGSRQQGGSAQAVNRNVKVTIGNKLSGRAPSHLPTSGVLSKPFGGGGSGAPRGGGRAPMQLEAPHGASLAARFDTLSGAPTSGPTRATGQPRRNAHGVIIP